MPVIPGLPPAPAASPSSWSRISAETPPCDEARGTLVGRAEAEVRPRPPGRVGARPPAAGRPGCGRRRRRCPRPGPGAGGAEPDAVRARRAGAPAAAAVIASISAWAARTSSSSTSVRIDGVGQLADALRERPVQRHAAARSPRGRRPRARSQTRRASLERVAVRSGYGVRVAGRAGRWRHDLPSMTGPMTAAGDPRRPVARVLGEPRCSSSATSTRTARRRAEPAPTYDEDGLRGVRGELLRQPSREAPRPDGMCAATTSGSPTATRCRLLALRHELNAVAARGGRPHRLLGAARRGAGEGHASRALALALDRARGARPGAGAGHLRRGQRGLAADHRAQRRRATRTSARASGATGSRPAEARAGWGVHHGMSTNPRIPR